MENSPAIHRWGLVWRCGRVLLGRLSRSVTVSRSSGTSDRGGAILLPAMNRWATVTASLRDDLAGDYGMDPCSAHSSTYRGVVAFATDAGTT